MNENDLVGYEVREKFKKYMRRHHVRGHKQKKILNWLRNFFTTYGSNKTFNLHVIMNECNLKMSNKEDYDITINILMRLRKQFRDCIELFFAPNGQYDSLKRQGLDDEIIFSKIILTAMSYDVYPIWSNRDNNREYELFTIVSFIALSKKRLHSAISEIENKGNSLNTIINKLPEAMEAYGEPIAISGVKKLIALKR